MAPPRVLVIEDEALVAMLIEDLLADMGAKAVGPAADLGSALDMALNESFDFALVDVNLSGEASFPVADVLIERGLPFAFLTGYGVAGVREDLRDHCVLNKPIDPTQLERALMGIGLGG